MYTVYTLIVNACSEVMVIVVVASSTVVSPKIEDLSSYYPHTQFSLSPVTLFPLSRATRFTFSTLSIIALFSPLTLSLVHVSEVAVTILLCTLPYSYNSHRVIGIAEMQLKMPNQMIYLNLYTLYSGTTRCKRRACTFYKKISFAF